MLNTETVIEFDFAPGDGQDFHAAKLMVSGHIYFHILTCDVATRSLGGAKGRCIDFGGGGDQERFTKLLLKVEALKQFTVSRIGSNYSVFLG